MTSSEKQLPARVIRLPQPSLPWKAELLWSLASHRMSVRYKETLFGFGWILLQPVALTIVYTYIFHRFAKISSGSVPYPLFAAVSLIAWSLTALVASQSTSCLVSHQAILKRVSMPRILLPLSVVIAALADLAVMVILLVALLVYSPIPLTPGVAWMVPVAVMHCGLLVGLACLFSLANVFLRDVGQAVHFLLQLWLFASPVFYPSSMVPREFQELARWNPLTGILEGYRSTLFYGKLPPLELFLPAVFVCLGILVLGLFCFWALEGIVADIL